MMIFMDRENSMGFKDHDASVKPLDHYINRVDALMSTGKTSEQMAKHTAVIETCNRYGMALEQFEDMVIAWEEKQKNEASDDIP